MKRSLLLFFSLILLGGCELYDQNEFTEHYVVESYLVANEELPMLRLSTTSSIDEEYKLSDNYVRDAEVEIRLLNSDSTVAETYPYSGNGTYYPVNATTVKPGHLYQLHINLSNGEVIKSTTRVPGSFTTVNELKGNYVFQGDEEIDVTVTPSEYPGRQTFYIFTVNVVDPDVEKLTPFFHDLVVEEGQNMKTYHKNNYGIINEESYQQNEDDTITLAVPWLAVAFYGENDITVNAIDDNMYDFLRTQSQQNGTESLLSGKLRNIEYNLNGAIGIFGSMATDTNRVNILPPEQ